MTGPTRWLRRLILAPLAVLVPLLALWRFLPPVSTPMLWQAARDGWPRRDYVPLAAISPHLVHAVVASEDARFCDHAGIDWHELGKVLDERSGPSRGASTITMQTARNLFLWQQPLAYLRKGLELPLALALETLWPKRRILEVYLNIAEWGDGIFGAEAAARAHFGKPAAQLTPREAALLAAALPNPILRNAGRPSRAMVLTAHRIAARSRAAPDGARCVF